jgi:hypothetical protein
MTDIVERLLDYVNDTDDVRIRVVAAEEIKSLRKQLEDRKSTNAGWRAHAIAKQELVEAQAEVEHYKQALENLMRCNSADDIRRLAGESK